MEWGALAGLQVQVDSVDNLRMRWTGRSPKNGQRHLLVIGSHLDTVRNAGRFDGTLGVLMGLACIEQLQLWIGQTDFDVEVVGFSDEEGLRFQTAYLGSSFYAGRFPDSWLKLRDSEGQTLENLLASRGRSTAEILASQAPPKSLMAYLEVHLEQGPRLEVEGRALGVVTAVAAQTRARLRFLGRADHAGTTPMDLRRDALCAAAEAVLTVERHAQRTDGLRATVGQITVHPCASNVVPDRAEMSLDLRHPSTEENATALRSLRAEIEESCKRRRVSVEWTIAQQGPSVVMNPQLRDHLHACAHRRQGETPWLVSGAGHDAVVMAQICPSAMLFLRCRGGISHHPDEFVSESDIEMGLAVLADSVRSWPQKDFQGPFV